MYSQPKIDIREVVNLLGLKVDPRCSINSDSVMLCTLEDHQSARQR